MATVTEHVELDVPVRQAYDQWTQFEVFPDFMEGIESVEQRDSDHLRWTARIGRSVHEWEAKITEQTPDQRIAWRDVDGKANAGAVTFHKLEDGKSRVTVQMDWEPEGIAESVGALLAMDDAKVKGDLERFKRFIEGREEPTGSWRGRISQDNG